MVSVSLDSEVDNFGVNWVEVPLQFISGNLSFTSSCSTIILRVDLGNELEGIYGDEMQVRCNEKEFSGVGSNDGDIGEAGNDLMVGKQDSESFATAASTMHLTNGVEAN